MAFAIVLYFDSRSTTQIKHVWTGMENTGVPSVRLVSEIKPHITLVTTADLDVDGLKNAVESFGKTYSRFDLLMSHIGIFTAPMRVLYLGVTPSPELTAIHAGFLGIFRDFARGINKIWHPELWVPHCTLGIDLSLPQILKALPPCLDLQLPIPATVVSLVCIDVDNGAELFELALGQNVAD